MLKRSILRGVAVCAFLAAAGSPPLSAQTTLDFTGASNWMVGYAANPPQQLLGIGAGAVLPSLGGWGFWTDVRLATDSPAREDSFDRDRTALEAELDGDLFDWNQSAWTSVNLSVVKGLTPEFAVYLGGGLSWETEYIRFRDPDGERGTLGSYWVEEDEQPEVHPNVQAGVFMRMGNRLALQFGGQTAPSGFNVGIFLRLF